MGVHRNDEKKWKLGSFEKFSKMKDCFLQKIVLKIVSMRLHNNNAEILRPKFFGRLSVERSILKKKLSEDGINAGKQRCQSKKVNNINNTFFMKDRFHLKLLWISYQREYTGVIVKKETSTFKKIYFIMKDCLSTKLSWRSYQWVWTGARIECRILKVEKLSDCEESFLQKTVLIIVSMRAYGKN